MSSEQPTLFDITEPKEPKSRAPRRRNLMAVADAGLDDCVNEGGPHLVQYRCERCGHESEWLNRKSVTDGQRNRPACPACNATREVPQ